ncbi:uncharacterized protein LOC124447557 [Xenia sp. Carnegie-2017]|uniref:uncharacterized protein LOC124447557 n=1 Tax=Xenia sp. Carnegie-2017 TaxID=2897299 RepID=UPI001F0490F2|nr:uncharacterized protein LOC124447557 [Xenia sp. Carnegie-2017]
MKPDIKIILLLFFVFCLVIESEGFWGRRSRSNTRSSSWRRSIRRTPIRRIPIRRTSTSRKSSGWFSGSSRSSSSSGSSKGFPHDVKTKSGLTKLYNKKVVSVQRVERPLAGLNNGKIGVIGVKIANKLGIKTSASGYKDRATHSGVVVRTSDGKRYLVHKGDGYGKSSQTVVVDAKHMSNKWKNVGSSKSGNGKNVGSFVKTGGPNYNVKGDNCHNAGDRMMKNGRKKRSTCG